MNSGPNSPVVGPPARKAALLTENGRGMKPLMRVGNAQGTRRRDCSPGTDHLSGGKSSRHSLQNRSKNKTFNHRAQSSCLLAGYRPGDKNNFLSVFRVTFSQLSLSTSAYFFLQRMGRGGTRPGLCPFLFLRSSQERHLSEEAPLSLPDQRASPPGVSACLNAPRPVF